MEHHFVGLRRERPSVRIVEHDHPAVVPSRAIGGRLVVQLELNLRIVRIVFRCVHCAVTDYRLRDRWINLRDRDTSRRVRQEFHHEGFLREMTDVDRQVLARRIIDEHRDDTRLRSGSGHEDRNEDGIRLQRCQSNEQHDAKRHGHL